jgi:uncharacterized protein
MLIDCHLHTVRRLGLPRNAQGDNFATPEQLIEMMDRTGVDKGVLLPVSMVECASQFSTTEEMLDICEQYPDRFIPFCNIDPRAESNSTTTDHSRQLTWYKEQGCKGVGEVTANLPFTDPRVLNFFAHCQACQMPLTFHISPAVGVSYGLVDDLNLPGLERCLKLFPDLAILGHSQAFWSEVDGGITDETRHGYPEGKVAPGGAVPRLLRDYPNLYGDISAGSGYNALTRDPEFGVAFVTEFHDRLLFGTDICSPKNDHRHAELLRAWRDEGKITEDVFENMAWRNVNRVLGLGL